MEWIRSTFSIKHGRAKPTYLHPKLEPILSVQLAPDGHQEQVMQIARDFIHDAGPSRRVTGVMRKKQKDQVGLSQEFVDGCIVNGIDETR